MKMQNYKIVYLLQIHQNAEQLLELFKAIFDSKNYYLLHIDAKANPCIYRTIYEALSHFENVHFMKRKRIYWADWSVTRMSLDAFRFLKRKGFTWDYFINLSGQCFPIKSQEHIFKELAANPQANYISSKPLSEIPKRFVRRLNVHICLHRVLRTSLPIPRWVALNQIHKGSAWVVLNKSFCEYLIGSKAVWKYRLFFRFTFIADEFFFATTAKNSPFNNSIVNRSFHFTKWNKGGMHPQTLTVADLEDIKKSKAFFARKFSAKVTDEMIEKLKQYIGA